MSSLVNEEQSRECGQEIIKVAWSKVENCTEINEVFLHCIKNAGVDQLNPSIPKLYNELSIKLFHARVNEFMTASVEIELERCGKAVRADQSLRDELKTYSALKSR